MRSVLQAPSDASGARVSEPGLLCSRPTRTNGSARFRGHRAQATAIIGESCDKRRSAISTYMHAQSVPLSQALVRLDGQYGNGAIVADLAGLAYVMRGKDYDLLDLESVQARLAQPPDQQTTHRRPGNLSGTL